MLFLCRNRHLYVTFHIRFHVIEQHVLELWSFMVILKPIRSTWYFSFFLVRTLILMLSTKDTVQAPGNLLRLGLVLSWIWALYVAYSSSIITLSHIPNGKKSDKIYLLHSRKLAIFYFLYLPTFMWFFIHTDAPIQHRGEVLLSGLETKLSGWSVIMFIIRLPCIVRWGGYCCFISVSFLSFLFYFWLFEFQYTTILAASLLNIMVIDFLNDHPWRFYVDHNNSCQKLMLSNFYYRWKQLLSIYVAMKVVEQFLFSLLVGMISQSSLINLKQISFLETQIRF